MNIRTLKFCIQALVLTTSVIFFTSYVVAETNSISIKVDQDSVSIYLQDSLLTIDSHQRALSRNSWFYLELDIGSYSFIFELSDYERVFKTVELKPGESETLDIKFSPASMTSILLGSVFVSSTPDSLSILIDGDDSDLLTPRKLNLSDGEHQLEVYKDGFEPLSHQLVMPQDSRLSLNFILKELPPEKPTAEDIGLFYFPQKPLWDMSIADKQMKQWMNLAETFAIIPLGQGLLAKAVLSEDQQSSANTLVITGLILTTSSYLIGYISSSRKRNKIIRLNEQVIADNTIAKENNKQVDISIREQHGIMLTQWRKENRSRGVVKVASEE